MSRRRGIAVCVALLGLLAWPGPATGANPLRQYRDALRSELALLSRAVSVERGVESLRREQTSLDHARRSLERHGSESLRRLDAYAAKREDRDHLTRRRARALYKLSRGGMLRLAFEPGSEGEDPAARVWRGRTVRRLVRHDLRELEVHRRAESRARAELLTASRELSAASSLHMIHHLQGSILASAGDQLAPQVRAAQRSRARLDPAAPLGARERRLLAEIARDRRALQYGRGLDLLDPRSLVRPVPGPAVGRFGDYVDPVLHLDMHRNGLELRADRRDQVRAVADGRVAMVGELPGFDQVVVLDHGGGYLSLTGRLLAVGVAEGDEVEAGQILGRPAPKAIDDGLGRTVYLELRHGERPIDPLAHLQPGRRG